MTPVENGACRPPGVTQRLDAFLREVREKGGKPLKIRVGSGAHRALRDEVAPFVRDREGSRLAPGALLTSFLGVPMAVDKLVHPGTATITVSFGRDPEISGDVGIDLLSISVDAEPGGGLMAAPEAYRSSSAAQASLADLRGWPDARVTLLILSDDGHPEYRWVIEAAPGQYLRRDGYIR